MKKTVQKLMNLETEIIIGNILRAGVISAATVVSVGGIIYLFRHGQTQMDYSVFRRQPPEFSTVDGIIRQVFSGRGRGMIQLGLLFLIATPIARVAFSVFAFARQRDRLYVAVTLAVLTILIYSLIGR
ncbi:MAG TPA: DUF1634 domain-containing protein [Elusimicrobia bacterium]|nr:DUF1634 domain-containing protein [Elusimicrobiota bacterium]